MDRVIAVIVASVSVDIYTTIIKLNLQKKHIAITIINIMAMETAICFISLFLPCAITIQPSHLE